MNTSNYNAEKRNEKGEAHGDGNENYAKFMAIKKFSKLAMGRFAHTIVQAILPVRWSIWLKSKIKKYYSVRMCMAPWIHPFCQIAKIISAA